MSCTQELETQTKSRETSGLEGKTELFPSGSDIKCIMHAVSRSLQARPAVSNRTILIIGGMVEVNSQPFSIA